MLSRLIRGLLVAALVAGWHGALVHPIEHVDELGHFVHAGHDHDQESSGPLCDVLDSLTSCISQSSVVLENVDASIEGVRFAQYDVRLPAAAPPFLSQAPPSLS